LSECKRKEALMPLENVHFYCPSRKIRVTEGTRPDSLLVFVGEGQDELMFEVRTTDIDRAIQRVEQHMMDAGIYQPVEDA
jgi:hypothetical protein